MRIVMVTGGIGSGKSALCKAICDRGAISLDLDRIAHGILMDDEQVKQELRDEFGSVILDEDGNVISSVLAERAFVDAIGVEALNKIMLPRIVKESSGYILNNTCVPRSDAPVMVVEVPLLTEVPELATLADEIIAVVAPRDLRLQRAIARGMDAQDVMRRMEFQATDAQCIALADTVCENDDSFESLEEWAAAWWDSAIDEIAREELQ